MPINYDMLPEHMRGGMQRYIERGILPGSFLTAVLENNLVLAALRADSTNRHRLLDFAEFLYSEAPSICWGSRASVDRWVERGGLQGLQEAEDDHVP